MGLLWGAVFTAAAAVAAGAMTTTFYVSPAGNDGNAGTSPSAPFATLARSVAAITSLRSDNGGRLPGPVDVLFAPGTYWLQDTVTIPPSAGGDPAAPVTFAALTPPPAPGSDGTLSNNVVFSGGVVVDSVSLVPGSTDVFNLTLPRAAQFTQSFVRSMWGGVNNTERRALTSTPQSTYTTLNYYGPNDAYANIVVPGGAIDAPPEALAAAFVVLYHSWTSSTNRVAYWNPANNTLGVGDTAADHFNTASGNRYRLQNVNPLLTPGGTPAMPPGTFYFDPGTWTALYRAVPGEDPTSTPLVAPRLATLVQVVNATNIHWANLTFAHTDAFLEEQCLSEGCCGQSASDLTTAMVEWQGVLGSSLTAVEIAHTGGYGMWLHGGCTDVSMSTCWVHDLGAGGVRVGEAVSGVVPDAVTQLAVNVTVSDCVVEDGGYIVEAGAGVLLQAATSCSILHNSIHDLWYTGVSTGWTWGYAPTSNADLTVGWNEIYNIGRGRLSDMGCIYNLGTSTGTVMINNVCHDVVAYGYGGWGLYSDEGTSNVVWRDNIVYNTKSAGYHQHYGLNVVVTNNVFAFPDIVPCDTNGCDSAAVRSSQHPPHTDPGSISQFALLTNILLLRNASATLFATTMPTGFVNMTLDYNVYWSTAVSPSDLTFPPTQAPTNWTQWRAEGKDPHSVLADPQFVSANGYDFSHLQPTSPALALGFQPINASTVGPRGWGQAPRRPA